MDKSFNLKVQTDEASLSKTNGQFTIEPLSRGYGITLGNANEAHRFAQHYHHLLRGKRTLADDT